jgi:Predicted sulfurtransferase
MDPNAGKSKLINRLGPEELRKRLAAEDFKRRTLSFYRYGTIADPQAYRDALYLRWTELQALGRIYLAREGINAQMNVPDPHWENFISDLKQDAYLTECR